MPLQIIRHDITKMACDAIVCPTNPALKPGGSLDLAIRQAAGEELTAACARIGVLQVGEAVITPGYHLPAKHVIHAVGPVWQGGDCGEEQLLLSCYRSVLAVALAHRVETLAIPLISSGTYGFPKDRVLKIAVKAIKAFLVSHEMSISLVVFDRNAYEISQALYEDVAAYIDDRYVSALEEMSFFSNRFCYSVIDTSRKSKRKELEMASFADTLEDRLAKMDKGFAETLFGYIDQKGLTDVECYKRANVDKKTFSKIKCNKDYRPSKVTAVSFAIALELTYDETCHLLKTVGMTLSRSNKFDIIIEYFISKGNYDIFEINETLFAFDQVLLGC